MKEQGRGLRRFLAELKRRKVYRVGATYVAAAFVVWQAAEIAFPSLGLPEAALRLVVVASLLGFPVAVALAWIYEVRPEPDAPEGGATPTLLGSWPVIATVVVLIVTAAVAYRVLRPGHEAPDSLRIAVFPLNTLSPGGETLGEGVADLISVGLDGAPGFTVVDPRALWPPLLAAGASPLAELGENAFTQASRRFEASHFVTGTVMDVGAALQVALRVYETKSGEPVASIRASASRDSLGRLVDQLTVDLVASLWSGNEIPAVGRVDQHATSDPQALAAYLEAMAHSRRGRFDEATEAIERAVAEDSTFALAHLEHFRIQSWVLSLNNQPLLGLREIIDRAMAFRERLTPRNRMRVEADRALDDTDAVIAAGLFERIVEIDPSDADAWASLAFLQAQYGWQVRRTFQETRPTLDRAIALDSLNVPLLNLLGLLQLIQGDTDGAAETLQSMDPEGPIPIGFRSGLSLLTAPENAVDSVIRDIADLDAGPVIAAIRNTRMVDLDRSRRLAEFLRDSATQALHRQLGRGAALQVLVARGEATRVDSLVHSPATTPAFRARVHQYLVAMALAGTGDGEVARHAAEALEEWAPLDSLSWAVDSLEDAWAAAWAAGAYHAALGDTTRAVAYRDAILSLPGGGIIPRWRESLAADIEARMAARRGQAEAALAAATRAYDLWTIHNPDEGGWYPEPAIRFFLADLLEASGREEDAGWLYRSFLPPHWDSFYTVLAQDRVHVEPASVTGKN
jgi:TolB-like protein